MFTDNWTLDMVNEQQRFDHSATCFNILQMTDKESLYGDCLLGRTLRLRDIVVISSMIDFKVNTWTVKRKSGGSPVLFRPRAVFSTIKILRKILQHLRGVYGSLDMINEQRFAHSATCFDKPLYDTQDTDATTSPSTGIVF